MEKQFEPLTEYGTKPVIIEDRLYHVQLRDQHPICRCNTPLVQAGWSFICPNRRWYNFFLHFRKGVIYGQ